MMIGHDQQMTPIDFYAPRKISGEHIVGALSVCLSVRPFSCPEHNLKTLGDNLFKLHTVVEGIEGECSVKEP
jgi:hypothetical protein